MGGEAGFANELAGLALTPAHCGASGRRRPFAGSDAIAGPHQALFVREYHGVDTVREVKLEQQV